MSRKGWLGWTAFVEDGMEWMNGAFAFTSYLPSYSFATLEGGGEGEGITTPLLLLPPPPPPLPHTRFDKLKVLQI